ncbi:hypothetical protein ACJX0J_021192, partial [Zea mays]
VWRVVHSSLIIHLFEVQEVLTHFYDLHKMIYLLAYGAIFFSAFLSKGQHVILIWLEKKPLQKKNRNNTMTGKLGLLLIHFSYFFLNTFGHFEDNIIIQSVSQLHTVNYFFHKSILQNYFYEHIYSENFGETPSWLA